MYNGTMIVDDKLDLQKFDKVFAKMPRSFNLDV